MTNTIIQELGDEFRYLTICRFWRPSSDRANGLPDRGAEGKRGHHVPGWQYTDQSDPVWLQ